MFERRPLAALGASRTLFAPNGVNFVTCMLLRYSVDMSRSGIRLAYYDLKTLFVPVISCSFIKS